MTPSAQDGPAGRKSRPDAEPVLFSEAEKVMAQWEAQHAVQAAGRHLGAVSVPQYMAHTRCAESPPVFPPDSTPRARSGRRGREHRPPPDTHPHLSDLWGWLTPPPGPTGRPAPRGGDRRD